MNPLAERCWRGDLLDFLTPSFNKAHGENQDQEFMEHAVNYWLRRFPSDVLPSSPHQILYLHDRSIERIEKAIESSKKGPEIFRKHLHDQLSQNLANISEIKVNSCMSQQSWKSELLSALRSFDVHYPHPFKSECPTLKRKIDIPWPTPDDILAGKSADSIQFYQAHYAPDPPYVIISRDRSRIRWRYMGEKGGL
ncbi:hypothetical protein VKT23_020397 [Stygiomarasmius scandens]|uniref:Uncharacterized protein n=1 Tax=Marasmiellus scandens TaxID=2682957 RepID=A0ABR1IJ68_9AGAR